MSQSLHRQHPGAHAEAAWPWTGYASALTRHLEDPCTFKVGTLFPPCTYLQKSRTPFLSNVSCAAIFYDQVLSSARTAQGQLGLRRCLLSILQDGAIFLDKSLKRETAQAVAVKEYSRVDVQKTMISVLWLIML